MIGERGLVSRIRHFDFAGSPWLQEGSLPFLVEQDVSFQDDCKHKVDQALLELSGKSTTTLTDPPAKKATTRNE